MTGHRRQPLIDLSEEDAAKLRKAGFNYQSITNWRKKICGPYPRLLRRVNSVLGRGVQKPAPIADPSFTTAEPVVDNRKPLVPATPPRVAPHVHIQVNPCVDDAVCLAVRTAAMQPVANTLLDQKREIPCMNCKQGIERAKAVAMKKTALRKDGLCACGEEKSWGAKMCADCLAESRKGRRATA